MTDTEQPQLASPGQLDALPDAGPLPLSFPAILRNPKPSNRFAHLHILSQDSSRRSCQPGTRKDRPEPEGKRWVRRRENAKFTHNPHITPPTSLDLAHPLQIPSSTFPRPLPSYLPRTLPVPSSRPPLSLPSTSSAGLFSFSLRGARRTLRTRPSSPYLVGAVETHLAAWLEGGTYLNPDQAKGLLHFPGNPIGGRDDIREVAREAERLVWVIRADPALASPGAFQRYVVHCIARWYGVVSFSRETDGHRLTYLLRPNVTRPDPRIDATAQTLDTPPTTDASDFHVSNASLSDFSVTDTSDNNAADASDVDSVPGDLPIGTRVLSDIEESRPSPTPRSVLGDSDLAIDSESDDADERGFAASMESLSLSTRVRLGDLTKPAETNTALTPFRLQNATVTTPSVGVELGEQGESPTSLRARADRDRLRTPYPRSTSSPSPARRSPHRSHTTRRLGVRRKKKTQNERKGFAGAVGAGKGSFYDYLFAGSYR